VYSLEVMLSLESLQHRLFGNSYPATGTTIISSSSSSSSLHIAHCKADKSNEYQKQGTVCTVSLQLSSVGSHHHVLTTS